MGGQKMVEDGSVWVTRTEMNEWMNLKRIQNTGGGDPKILITGDDLLKFSLNCLQLEVGAASKRLESWESYGSWKSHSDIETRCRKSAAQLKRSENYQSTEAAEIRPRSPDFCQNSIALALLALLAASNFG